MAETEKLDSPQETLDKESEVTERNYRDFNEEEEIKWSEQLFKKTNNCIFIWRAIYFATESNRAIPGWCLPYLNSINKSIKETADNTLLNTHDKAIMKNNRENIRKFINAMPRSFGFTKSGKNAFIEFASIARVIYISANHQLLKRYKELSLNKTKNVSIISYDTIYLIMNALNIADERHLRRLISRGNMLDCPIEDDEPRG